MGNNKKERPELSKELLENIKSREEYFQNEVIRPIIKMQSDLGAYTSSI